MVDIPESKLEFDPADLQYVTPSDRAKALPLSGEILFLASDKGPTLVLGYRSTRDHRYVVLARPDESPTTSTRWTIQNVSTVPLPSAEPEELQDVLSAHRVGGDRFHLTDLGAMTIDEFNQRFGHTDLADLGETQ